MKISDLPDEYRALAEKRREEETDSIYSNISNDLARAFYWHATPEGGEFWVDVAWAFTTDELPSIPGHNPADEKLKRSDGTMSDPISPDHYENHPEGVACIKITQHFPGNLSNAIKYIWRSENMSKKLALRDLRKAKKCLEYEIERVESGPERTLYQPFQGYQRPEVLAHDNTQRSEAVRNDAGGSGAGGRIDEHDGQAG